MTGQADSPQVLVVIPARYESSRFPGKALADLCGQPLIVRTVANAQGMRLAGQIIVATDDQRILNAVTAAGYTAEITADHATGTDRIGEVAARQDADIILNLQGDEPLLDPVDADHLVQTMLDDPTIDIATCAHSFSEAESWQDPNTVKVVVDRSGLALYFSRAPIPGTFPGGENSGPQAALRHVGIYAFRQSALKKFLTFERTPLEKAEGLEQLRALENGLRIKVVRIKQEPVGVDTPADLEKVRSLFKEKN